MEALRGGLHGFGVSGCVIGFRGFAVFGVSGSRVLMFSGFRIFRSLTTQRTVGQQQTDADSTAHPAILRNKLEITTRRQSFLAKRGFGCLGLGPRGTQVYVLQSAVSRSWSVVCPGVTKFMSGRWVVARTGHTTLEGEIPQSCAQSTVKIQSVLTGWFITAHTVPRPTARSISNRTAVCIPAPSYPSQPSPTTGQKTTTTSLH